MAPKIFLTGVTGYIGGDIFYEIYNAHPEYEYTLLVRNEERGKAVSEKYSKVRLVYGSLDDADVLEKEAAAADIVIHTADSADNVPSAKAIAKGLAAGHSAEKPGYWLHICGTGMLQWYDDTNKRFGEGPLPEQKYDDIANIDKILSIPDQAIHRDVDKIVLAANDTPGVVTAIVGPPTIYGAGRGPVNQRSQQVYAMARFLLHNGYAPIVGAGKAEWDNVHINDVSSLMLLLAEAAQDGGRNKDEELFGKKGYYFCENGEHHVWSQVAQWVADEAYRQGFMGEAKTERLSMDELKKITGSKFNSSYGMNSKSVAARARKYLGWQPKGRGLKDEIAGIVAGEAKILGIEPTAPKH